MQNLLEGHEQLVFKMKEIIMTFRASHGAAHSGSEMSIVRGKWIITMKRRDEFQISRHANFKSSVKICSLEPT